MDGDLRVARDRLGRSMNPWVGTLVVVATVWLIICGPLAAYVLWLSIQDRRAERKFDKQFCEEHGIAFTAKPPLKARVK
jgi:hypothetical protein